MTESNDQDEVLEAIRQASAAMLQSVMQHDPTAVALAAIGIVVSIGQQVPDANLKAVILKSLEDAAANLRGENKSKRG